LPTSILSPLRRAAVPNAGRSRVKESEQVLRTYERIAPFYDLLDLPFEHARYRSLRPLLFAGLSGRILDAGVGTGRNIAHYPPGAEVIGIDLSAGMLDRAERRRSKSAAAVRLMQMDLTKLQFADDAFDAAVASFVFCTMPAAVRRAALRELSRVVKPGGTIRLLEYGPAKSAFRRRLARMWQPWTEWAFGATLNQDVEPELSDASWIVTQSRYVTGTIKLIEARQANQRRPDGGAGRSNVQARCASARLSRCMKPK
jgi:ubiquinone/menaquinone biosynthesis C-methylase UbiE